MQWGITLRTWRGYNGKYPIIPIDVFFIGKMMINHDKPVELGATFFKQTHVPKMIDSNRPRFSVPEAIDTKSEACCCTQHTQFSQEVLFMFFLGCDTLSIFVYLSFVLGCSGCRCLKWRELGFQHGRKCVSETPSWFWKIRQGRAPHNTSQIDIAFFTFL